MIPQIRFIAIEFYEFHRNFLSSSCLFQQLFFCCRKQEAYFWRKGVTIISLVARSFNQWCFILLGTVILVIQVILLLASLSYLLQKASL